MTKEFNRQDQKLNIWTEKKSQLVQQSVKLKVSDRGGAESDQTSAVRGVPCFQHVTTFHHHFCWCTTGSATERPHFPPGLPHADCHEKSLPELHQWLKTQPGKGSALKLPGTSLVPIYRALLVLGRTKVLKDNTCGWGGCCLSPCCHLPKDTETAEQLLSIGYETPEPIFDILA